MWWFSSILLWSQVDPTLNYLPFGRCVILGDLHFLNLITSCVKRVYDAHFTGLLLILHEPYAVAEARGTFTTTSSTPLFNMVQCRWPMVSVRVFK